MLSRTLCHFLAYRAGKIASDAEFKEVVSLLGVDGGLFEEVNINPLASDIT